MSVFKVSNDPSCSLMEMSVFKVSNDPLLTGNVRYLIIQCQSFHACIRYKSTLFEKNLENAGMENASYPKYAETNCVHANFEMWTPFHCIWS